MALTNRVVVALCAMAASAWAQDPPPPAPNAPATPTTYPTYSPPAPYPTYGNGEAVPTPTTVMDEKLPKPGDFDAGGNLKFPNGPDTEGKYATYNWIAVDLKGKYQLFDVLEVNANIPLAVHHPDTLPMSQREPKLFGGINARLELKTPKPPVIPLFNYEATLGLVVSAAYMHEKAMLLSDKDFPLFVGNYEPGLTAGLIMKLKLSSLLDFSFLPLWIHQANPGDAIDALQVPLALIIKLGSVVKLQAELGIYTGDGLSLRARDDGRVQAGGSLDVKVWKLLLHAGAGAASLVTGGTGMYPSVRDSVYVELNVKYEK